PKRLESCCEKIAALPYGNERLPLECKYESIRKFAYMRFVREDVDTWETYSPREEEQKLFYACLKVKQELDKAIRREKGENL
ncbi:MAG: hypothetical protein IJ066_01575, partial [Bacteroidaceae bacterium]|nr:hypothetical protein [Bacteroidaceae bacterium]